MKAFINPLLLILCILLLAFGATTWLQALGGTTPPDEAAQLSSAEWVLYICLMAVIVNGALGLARALSQRPSLPSIGWAVLFLLFGSSVWAITRTPVESLTSAEKQLLAERVIAWQGGQLNPYSPDENGDSLLTLAAGLGQQDLLADLLADPSALQAHPDAFARAAHRAAERNRDNTLRQLLAAGLPPDARWEGMTILHTATLCRAHRALACLLELGAPVNETDADDATPLHHAVLADDEEAIRLLLQHGADPTLGDADGRTPASYARSESILNALSPAPEPPAAPPAP